MIENPFFDLNYASIIPKSAESPIKDQSICLSSFENLILNPKSDGGQQPVFCQITPNFQQHED